MWVFAIVLLLAAAMQGYFGLRVYRHQPGEPWQTTQGQQLDAMLGRRGSIAFFIFNACLLAGLAVLMILRNA
ncbi:MAG: hypothetical protein AB7K71_28835 [Polyangiaceae bacterium]